MLSKIIKKYYVGEKRRKTVKYITTKQVKELLSNEPDNPFIKIISGKIPITFRTINMNIIVVDNISILTSKEYSEQVNSMYVKPLGFISNTLLYMNQEISIISVTPVLDYLNVKGKFRIEKYKNSDNKKVLLVHASLPDLVNASQKQYYYLIDNKTGEVKTLHSAEHVISSILQNELNTKFSVDIKGIYTFYSDYVMKCGKPYYELKNFIPIKVDDSTFEGRLTKILSTVSTTSNYRSLLTIDGYKKILFNNRTKYVKIYKCGKKIVVIVKNKRGSRMFILKKMKK